MGYMGPNKRSNICATGILESMGREVGDEEYFEQVIAEKFSHLAELLQHKPEEIYVKTHHIKISEH